jgi:hypothetical protein
MLASQFQSERLSPCKTKASYLQKCKLGKITFFF